jgi:putative PIG3 family NAD(P)H quinone oxidoreductase
MNASTNAMILKNKSATYSLEMRAIPMPVASPNQVVIKVAAAGVNRADIFQARGQYSPIQADDEALEILGLEVSGTVVDVGADVSEYEVGDKVMALLNGGGYGNHVVAHENLVMPIPQGVPLIDAAALPEALFTCWSNLVDDANIQAGENVLIHGGGSGIGVIAIQLAKWLGANVITTAGTDEKVQGCLELGADLAINYKNTDFVTAIQNSPFAEVDAILDIAGGDYTTQNIKLLQKKGRLQIISLLRGRKAEIDLGAVLMKNLAIRGSTLRGKSLAEKSLIASQLKNRLIMQRNFPIRPIIDKVLDLSEAMDAHKCMENNFNFGKILLKVGS